MSEAIANVKYVPVDWIDIGNERPAIANTEIMNHRMTTVLSVTLMACLSVTAASTAKPTNLLAGAAKVDITHPESMLVGSSAQQPSPTQPTGVC